MTDTFEQMPPEVLVHRTTWLDSRAREVVGDPHRAGTRSTKPGWRCCGFAPTSDSSGRGSRE